MTYLVIATDKEGTQHFIAKTRFAKTAKARYELNFTLYPKIEIWDSDKPISYDILKQQSDKDHY
jgi:hypothetical protein